MKKLYSYIILSLKYNTNMHPLINAFINAAVFYIVLSRDISWLIWAPNVAKCLINLIAIDSLYIGINLLKVGGELENIAAIRRYFVYGVVCSLVWVLDRLTWGIFGKALYFVALFAAIPSVLREIYDAFDYFSDVPKKFDKTIKTFTDFILFSLLGIVFRGIGDSVGINVTIGWKFLRQKYAFWNISQFISGVANAFVDMAAKNGSITWLTKEIILRGVPMLTRGTPLGMEKLEVNSAPDPSSYDAEIALKGLNSLKRKLVLQKLINAGAWDIIMDGRILPSVLNIVLYGSDSNAFTKSAIIIHQIERALGKFVAIYSIICVINMPGISLLITAIISWREIAEKPLGMGWTLLIIGWWVGTYLYGEFLAAFICQFILFVDNSLTFWIIDTAQNYLEKKVHDIYFGFNIKADYNFKISTFTYVDILLNISRRFFKYLIAAIFILVCVNKNILLILICIAPLTFSDPKLYMLLILFGFFSSYNFVHLIFIALIVFIVREFNKKPQQINIAKNIIEEYGTREPEQNFTADKNIQLYRGEKLLLGNENKIPERIVRKYGMKFSKDVTLKIVEDDMIEDSENKMIENVENNENEKTEYIKDNMVDDVESEMVEGAENVVLINSKDEILNIAEGNPLYNNRFNNDLDSPKYQNEIFNDPKLITVNRSMFTIEDYIGNQEMPKPQRML